MRTYNRGTHLLDSLLDTPDADSVVSVTSIESGSVVAPGQGDGLALAGLRAAKETGSILSKVSDEVLALEIPNLNRFLSSSAEPVSDRAEAEGMDDRASLETVELLALAQIPQNCSSVTTAGRAKRAVRGDSDGVDVAGVALEVLNELAVVQVPDFDKLVPASRNNNRVGSVGRELDAAGPEGVVVFLDDEFALAKRVPQADGAVTRARDDLTIVGAEGNAQDVLLVANEASGGSSSLNVPKSKSAVPGSRESELTIGRDDNILDMVSMAEKSSLGKSGTILMVECPDQQRFISGGRDDHVRALGGRGDGSDPSVVSSQNTFQDEIFSHFV